MAKLLSEAAAVLEEARADFISAAKRSDVLFAAAHALQAQGDKKEALEYYQHGLRLSPWNLDEQLACARLKKETGSEAEALKTAQMVLSRTESDALANEALKMLGKPAVQTAPLWDGKAQPGVWLCFVRLGPVQDVMLADTVERISKTLGLPALVAPEKLALPAPGRSALQRFVQKNVIPKMNWAHPAADRLLRSLGKSVPEEVPPKQLVEALISNFRKSGMGSEADSLQRDLAFYHRCDRQWKSDMMLGMVRDWANTQPHAISAIVIGITEADLYEDNVNYLFGTALTGGRRCVTSSSRFRADLMGEPPDRKRLVARVHRQLLSSIGFSLNVPRPTDPTSARAYPASVPEQDAKSEYMSEDCIRGFENALNRTLPAEAHAPEYRSATGQ